MSELLISSKKPASVAVWASVTLTGEKIPLILIEEVVEISQHAYLNILREKLVPWINAAFKESSITLQQDGAKSNTANRVQERCNRNVAGFWTKELWPPSSHD